MRTNIYVVPSLKAKEKLQDEGRAWAEEKGFSFDEESIKHFSDGRVLVIYAKEQIGGFAIHLMQK